MSSGVTGKAMRWGALVLLAFACWPWSPAKGQHRSDAVHFRVLRVPGPDGRQVQAQLIFPRHRDRREHPPGHRYPLVVALHGLGESRRGPERGFRGWSVDYRLQDAFAALRRGQLSTEDYQGMVSPEHLGQVNRELRTKAFEGVAVLAPYVPVELAPGSAHLRDYCHWVAGPLLETVRTEFPGVAQGREGTGVDGVSHGGRIALELGIRHPETFGAVGAMQPAIRDLESRTAERWAEVPAANRPKLRLLSSDRDPYLPSVQRLSSLLRGDGVAHRLTTLPGTHSYTFNRGPGGLEMLRFAAEVLRYEPLDQ